VVAERRAAPFAWIAALAFASGFPFGLINEALPVYLRSGGASLVDVGFVAAATFPWTFKFLWAPVLDRTGTRKQWIAGCLVLLVLVIPLIARVDASQHAQVFFGLIVLAVTLSATQDVAIDAFTIQATPREQLGLANSVRIGAYRTAMLVSGGAIIWLAGRKGWPVAFTAATVVTALLAAAALFLPNTGQVRPPAGQSLWLPLRSLLTRPGIKWVLAFALLFKLGDAAMDPMTRPFWVDRGFTLEEIGVVLTTGRMVATVSGAVLGGYLTTRWGMRKALWSLGALQAVSNLGYWVAAAVTPSKGLMIAAALFENFSGGMGTAAFVAFLMSVCEPRFAASQYALLSALLALTRAIIGPIAGSLTERVGYATFFLLTFLLALPGFALLPFLSRAAPPPDDVSATAH
jgi:MFS transporter, PAT family, beta-lactamase induction signal transducer AmpG